MNDQCTVYCNDLGSSRKVQVGYVGVAAVALLVGMVLTLWEFVSSDNLGHDESLGRVLGRIIVFLTFISFWVMVSSRCCAPCFCASKMPDVPEPCPIGPCKPNNPKLLDYPLLILFAGQGWIGVFQMVVELVTDSGDLTMLRIWRLVWLLVALLGLFTGIMKWKVMWQSGNSEVETVTTTVKPVVGEPIRAEN